jgi:hypothetical protein
MHIDLKSPWWVLPYSAVVWAAFVAAVVLGPPSKAAQDLQYEQAQRRRAIIDLFATELGLRNVSAMTDEQIGGHFADHVDESRVLPDPAGGPPVPLVRVYGTPPAPDAARSAGDLVGYAVPVSGMGYIGLIRGYVGVTPNFAYLLGLAVARQEETPGMGSQIEDAWFCRKFRGLTASPPPPGGRFVYIGGDPNGTADPRFGRCVQAISGATETCYALEGIIHEGMERFCRAAKAAGMVPEMIPTGP